MNTLPELLAEVPQRGRVRWLGVRPQSREAVLEPEAVEARREAGGQPPTVSMAVPWAAATGRSHWLTASHRLENERCLDRAVTSSGSTILTIPR